MCLWCLNFSMEGGELFSRIQERADAAFTERGLHPVTDNFYMLGLISDPAAIVTGQSDSQKGKYFW